MRDSVTQRSEYGCGIACFAFVCNMTYQEAVRFLGKEYSVKHGWRPSDLVKELNNYGYSYKNNYVRQKHINTYNDGTIVLIERSAQYPVGHYLVLNKDNWMDPWINMQNDNDIEKAKSGYIKQLPGKPMYALIPVEI